MAVINCHLLFRTLVITISVNTTGVMMVTDAGVDLSFKRPEWLLKPAHSQIISSSFSFGRYTKWWRPSGWIVYSVISPSIAASLTPFQAGLQAVCEHDSQALYLIDYIISHHSDAGTASSVDIVSLQKDEWFIWSHISKIFLIHMFSEKDGVWLICVDVSSVCRLAALTPVALHWPSSPMCSQENGPIIIQSEWELPSLCGMGRTRKRADILQNGPLWCSFGGRWMVVDSQVMVEFDLDCYCVSSQ